MAACVSVEIAICFVHHAVKATGGVEGSLSPPPLISRVELGLYFKALLNEAVFFLFFFFRFPFSIFRKKEIAIAGSNRGKGAGTLYKMFTPDKYVYFEWFRRNPQECSSGVKSVRA